MSINISKAIEKIEELFDATLDIHRDKELQDILVDIAEQVRSDAIEDAQEEVSIFLEKAFDNIEETIEVK